MKKIMFMISLLFCVFLTGCLDNAASKHQSSEEEKKIINMSNAEIVPCNKGNSRGYYYTDTIFPMSANLIYVDYETKQELPLCSRPECTHDNESCTSYFLLDENMAVPDPYLVGDYIFYTDGILFGDNVTFCQMELNGENRRKVFDFPSNFHILSEKMYTDEKSLYFFVDELKKNDDEDIVAETKLIQLQLSNGDIHILKEYPIGEPAHEIVGSIGRNLILRSFFWNYDKGEDYIVYNLFNVNNSDEQEIKRLDMTNEPIGSEIVGEYLYEQYYDKHEIKRTHLLSGEQESFSYSSIFMNHSFVENIQELFFVEFENIIRIEINEIEDEETNIYSFILDVDSGVIEEFNLFNTYKNQPIQIKYEYDDFLLVLKDWKVNITQNEDGQEIHNSTPQYAIISKGDYADSHPNYHDISSFR